ncbi:MAG TPA: hypothetical protein VH062_09180 [Polyangiaceae bacterium]|nr:hypothetical protein [Polyangiaceae bacterium]
MAALVTAVASLCVPAPLHAEERATIDLQPAALYFGPRGSRSEISVIGFTYGNRHDSLFPYFGAGVGFFTLQARGGITWMPGDLEESGLIVRLEAQPQLLFNPCVEPLLLGTLGVGWRWPLERGDPGNPGTAIFVLPAFAGGDGFLHQNCGKDTQGPMRSSLILGGTLFAGFDW